MIDPFKITNYDRTDAELEEFFLFCLAVAGKKATMIAKKIDDCFGWSLEGLNLTPFEFILQMPAKKEGINALLRAQRMGKYKLLTDGYWIVANKGNAWLRSASADDIVRDIPGAGYKTSRFFTLHSRRNENVAVIDTHMLKYLRHIGAANVPEGIPSGKEYLRLEKVLLAEAQKRQMAMANFDLAIWSHYASRGATPLP